MFGNVFDSGKLTHPRLAEEPGKRRPINLSYLPNRQRLSRIIARIAESTGAFDLLSNGPATEPV